MTEQQSSVEKPDEHTLINALRGVYQHQPLLNLMAIQKANMMLARS